MKKNKHKHTYTIVYDTYDNEFHSYILFKECNDIENVDIILEKRVEIKNSMDKDNFNEEIKNLAKYFDAKLKGL